MPELNERVSVLEVKIENMEETLKRLDINQKEHAEITLQIKERLDKQNGLIPHMAESVREIADSQKELMKQMNAEAVDDASAKVKLGILWALVGAIGMGLLGYVLKGFLG